MADIDKTSPADDDVVSQYPANERNSRAAIETIIGIDHRVANDGDQGKHENVTFKEQSADPSTGSNVFKLYTKESGGKSELFARDEDSDVIQLTKAGAVQAFPTGTKLLFPQETAPVGWTKDTDVDDKVLRVVDDTTGGDEGGSWTLSGLTMPHTHGVSGTTGTASANLLTVAQVGEPSANPTSQSHTHSFSATSGAASSSTVVSSGAWRPAYLNVIKATKD